MDRCALLIACLLGASCSAAPKSVSGPTDSADGPGPAACTDLSFSSLVHVERADLPQRGDPSGTQPGGALGDLDRDGDLDGMVGFGGGVSTGTVGWTSLCPDSSTIWTSSR